MARVGGGVEAVVAEDDPAASPSLPATVPEVVRTHAVKLRAVVVGFSETAKEPVPSPLEVICR